MPEEIKVSKCPICGGLWAEGECYKCGAYLDGDRVVVPKPGEAPQAAPAAAPQTTPAPKPERDWDEP